MHCIHLSHFFFRVIRFFSIVTLVYSVYIAFPYVMHLYTLVTLFLVLHQKIFVPRSGQLFFHRHTCIQWFHSFSLYNALYTLVTLFLVLHQKIFVPRNGQFFHRHTCIQWLHSFSLCNAFVYTCHTFFQHHQKIFVTLFLVLHQKIFVPRSGQLFFHRHTCIQCLHSFSYVMHLYTLVTLFLVLHQKIFVPRNGQFFHRHTCIQWLHSFSLCNAFVYTCHTFFQHHQKIFAPCILLCTACLSLFNSDVPFKELVIYNLLHER